VAAGALACSRRYPVCWPVIESQRGYPQSSGASRSISPGLPFLGLLTALVTGWASISSAGDREITGLDH
jgi:hypothetical protein